MSNLSYIKVSADREKKIIEVNPNVKKPAGMDNLDFFHDNVSNIIDITNLGMFDYEKDIAFIVDDEGLLISNNIVYLIEIGEHSMHIAGDFLIGKNELSDDGMHTVGLTKGEIDDLMKNYGLRVSVVGLTK